MCALEGNEKAKATHETCLKALQFELEQFWKRSLFFWGFIGAAFVAFAASSSHPSLQAAIASFGFVCSVVWTLANRGSKFWYENWETKLIVAEKEVTGTLYGSPGNEKTITEKWYSVEGLGKRWWKGRRYSPSKLAITLSDYTVVFWLCVLAYEIRSLFLGIALAGSWQWPLSREVFALAFVAFSVVLGVLLRWLCHTSKD
jgi:hypothetical protein